MRIVVDARKVGDLGIGTYIRQLGESCARLAPEHEFVFLVDPAAASGGSGEAGAPFVGPNVRWVANGSRRYGLAELVTVSRQARRLGADLFHAPHYVYPLGVPCPGVVTVHDCIHLRFPRQLPYPGAWVYARAMLARAVRVARRVIAVSAATRADLIALVGADPDRIEVIPNGCDPYFFEEPSAAELRAFREQYGLPDAFVLYAGNLKPHKNVEGLLEAFAMVAAGRRQLGLVVVGEELRRYPRLGRLRDRLGLRDRARFLGYLPRSELRAAYALAAVLALPSLYEGFGLPALEAMACGTPVVASDRGGLPEVVGDAGCLVDPEDRASLADAIDRVLADGELRQRLSYRGRRRARGFRWEETARRVLELYARVAGG